MHDTGKNTKRYKLKSSAVPCGKKRTISTAKNLSVLFSVMSEVNYVPWPRAL